MKSQALGLVAIVLSLLVSGTKPAAAWDCNQVRFQDGVAISTESRYFGLVFPAGDCGYNRPQPKPPAPPSSESPIPPAEVHSNSNSQNNNTNSNTSSSQSAASASAQGGASSAAGGVANGTQSLNNVLNIGSAFENDTRFSLPSSANYSLGRCVNGAIAPSVAFNGDRVVGQVSAVFNLSGQDPTCDSDFLLKLEATKKAPITNITIVNQAPAAPATLEQVSSVERNAPSVATKKTVVRQHFKSTRPCVRKVAKLKKCFCTR